MKIPLIVAAATALAFTAPISQATVISSTYAPLGGGSWLVDFTVTNDGTPATFAGFTIDIPEATNLVVRGSPSTWDSLVFQPDPNLPDVGAFDSFVKSASNALVPGQSIGGFQMAFSYTSGARPGPLPFVVYSETFTPLFAGTTTIPAIPEPPMVFLAALGLTFVGLRVRMAKKSVGEGKGVAA